jgi:Cu(I)/Ag(I) efflux system membrane protein CusA/SilA
MLRRVIDWSTRNRFLVGLAVLCVAGAGVWAIRSLPLDALPDLTDVQVIVQTDFAEQAPQIVEDQVTYPITTQMLKVPGAKNVRGYSFFGMSLVYVIFEDGTDLYWARSRVIEYLSGLRGRLPGAANPTLGPDATGLGWVYEYVLTSDRHSLYELRAIQDWYLRYVLTSVPGVSEVASVGGYEKQYQVASGASSGRSRALRETCRRRASRQPAATPRVPCRSAPAGSAPRPSYAEAHIQPSNRPRSRAPARATPRAVAAARPPLR